MAPVSSVTIPVSDAAPVCAKTSPGMSSPKARSRSVPNQRLTELLMRPPGAYTTRRPSDAMSGDNRARLNSVAQCNRCCFVGNHGAARAWSQALRDEITGGTEGAEFTNEETELTRTNEGSSADAELHCPRSQQTLREGFIRSSPFTSFLRL